MSAQWIPPVAISIVIEVIVSHLDCSVTLTRGFSLSQPLGGRGRLSLPEPSGLAPASHFSVSASRMKLMGSKRTAIHHSVLPSPALQMTTSDRKVAGGGVGRGADSELMPCIWREAC